MPISQEKKKRMKQKILSPTSALYLIQSVIQNTTGFHLNNWAQENEDGENTSNSNHTLGSKTQIYPKVELKS